MCWIAPTPPHFGGGQLKFNLGDNSLKKSLLRKRESLPINTNSQITI